MVKTKRTPLVMLSILAFEILLSSCTPAQAPATGQIPSTGAANGTSQSPSITEIPQDPYAGQRQAMVADTIQARGVSNPEVLRAMLAVPRHEFVPPNRVEQAYADHPLPIGYGQTISQPFIVAWMTELLELKPGEKVLEIGTGSGYQAAILAELGGLDVYSIEIVPELAESAAARLAELGYDQVKVKQGDGYYGWPEVAPFDAIIITAAPDHLPAPLAAQLKYAGRLVVPIGPPGGYQALWKFVKEPEGLKGYNLGAVSFVPFVREVEAEPAAPAP